MPSNPYALLNVTDLNALVEEAIAAGRIAPAEAVAAVQKAATAAIAKAANAGATAWPADMAPKPNNTGVLIRQHIAHGHG